MLEIKQIPVLQDNYVYCLRDSATGAVSVVDPSVSEPVLDFLIKEKWKLTSIVNTHHHWDHVGGNLEIKEATGCPVIGAEKDRDRIPGIDETLKEGSAFRVGESEALVWEIPGHTTGHIALWFQKEKSLFCGDTLFSLGCGRLFEGTPSQMFESLKRLQSLPDDTKVYCAHEYTAANARFAEEVDPGNAALKKMAVKIKELREKKQSTVPSLMGDEKRCNPFLLAKTVEDFTKMRLAKDKF